METNDSSSLSLQEIILCCKQEFEHFVGRCEHHEKRYMQGWIPLCHIRPRLSGDVLKLGLVTKILKEVMEGDRIFTFSEITNEHNTDEIIESLNYCFENIPLALKEVLKLKELNYLLLDGKAYHVTNGNQNKGFMEFYIKDYQSITTDIFYVNSNQNQLN